MSHKIVERILRETNHPDLLDVLVNQLSPTDLQSLLLEVYRQRAGQLSPGELLRQHQENRFVTPSQLSPQRLLDFDGLAFSLLPPGFETIELSPVAPLGTCAGVATVNQNKVLSTIRNTEVCADPTNVMALECASRRRALFDGKAFPAEPTKLCASQRVLRTQALPGPGFFAHFRVFSLCTAGRDSGSYQFEIASLIEQVQFYLHLYCEARLKGFTPGAVKVVFAAFDAAFVQTLQTKIATPLAEANPDVDFVFDQERTSGYYLTAGFQISISDASGTELFIADGGFTDWTQQLLSNRKERLLISGMGSERFVLYFG